MKRLMGRYGTREEAIDRMLRAGLFVDLHRVTKETLRASVESYSLKALEPFFGFERSVDLREASAHLREVEIALELGEPESIGETTREAVVGYNQDDCLATWRLREWLEVLSSIGEDGMGEELRVTWEVKPGVWGAVRMVPGALPNRHRVEGWQLDGLVRTIQMLRTDLLIADLVTPASLRPQFRERIPKQAIRAA